MGRERGVALISVLLVFALAAIITSQVASRNFRDIRKTANLLNSKQAYHYALAGEQLARQLLYRDFIDNKPPRSDQLSDNWANIDQVFDIENGSMTINITDLHSKFNINNLLTDSGQINGIYYQQFINLLSELGIDTRIARGVIDWMDSNEQPIAGGAEDDVYAELEYLPANQFMADRSELRMIHKLSFTDYAKLKDHVVALPVTINNKATGITSYNLNTLDAKMLEVLAAGAQSNSISRIASRQQQGGYSTLNEWFSRGDATALLAVQNTLTTQSQFFELEVKAVFGDRISIIRSQLYRDGYSGKITMIKRQQGSE